MQRGRGNQPRGGYGQGQSRQHYGGQQQHQGGAQRSGGSGQRGGHGGGGDYRRSGGYNDNAGRQYGRDGGPPRQGQPLPVQPFDEALLEQFAGLQLSHGGKYAEKLERGTAGTPCSYLSNLFPLKLEEELTVYHYDVAIARKERKRAVNEVLDDNKVLPKSLNHKVMNYFIGQNSGKGEMFAGLLPVFDGGKNLYTARALSDNDEEPVEVSMKEDEKDKDTKDFLLRIRKADPFKIVIPANCNSLEHEAIQILDIIIRYGPTRSKIPIGQKIFYPVKAYPESREPLARNMEFAFGFYQSVRCCEIGLVLNVDRVGGTFYQAGHLFQVICRLLGWPENSINAQSSIPDEKHDFLRRELKGVQFRTGHLSRRQTATGLSKESVKQIYFDQDEGGKISVYDYFKEKYGISLRCVNMPCLVTKMGKKNAYFPLEVCEVVEDQFVRKKLPKDVCAEFTRVSVQKPHKRFIEIHRAAMTILEEGRQYLKEFKIELVINFIAVPGRVIATPDLQYQNSNFTPPETATWNLMHKKLYRTVALTNWVLVGFGGSSREAVVDFSNRFSDALIRCAKNLGMTIEPPRAVVPFNFTDVASLKTKLFEEAVRRYTNPQMLVCLVPGDEDTYNAIKECGDHECGIVTQCVAVGKHRDGVLKPPFLANVLLNMNAKLGGINVIARDMPPETMVIGIDVTHPSPGSGIKRSIAACVATYDNTLTLFDAEVRVQPSFVSLENGRTKRVYEMVEVGPVIDLLLTQYKKHNKNALPKRILVYRDGVSEGQFDEVMRKEKDALVGLFDGRNSPKITYIVVQKRHNVRVATEGNMDNPPPGTVLDVGVADPVIFDFFLCSHKAIQGTSRPTRYRVLYDENRFSADQIQKLTNNLCFTYSSCAKAIAIPTPVKYADAAAYRARIFIDDHDDASTVHSEDDDELPDDVLEQLNESIQRHEKLRGKQYYV